MRNWREQAHSCCVEGGWEDSGGTEKKRKKKIYMRLGAEKDQITKVRLQESTELQHRPSAQRLGPLSCLR